MIVYKLKTSKNTQIVNYSLVTDKNDQNRFKRASIKTLSPYQFNGIAHIQLFVCILTNKPYNVQYYCISISIMLYQLYFFVHYRTLL